MEFGGEILEGSVCGVGCAAGRLGEMLLCGLKRGHQGQHAWGSLPTFAAGRITGPDSFAAGVEASAKWLECSPVSPPEALDHWRNAAYALRWAANSNRLSP